MARVTAEDCVDKVPSRLGLMFLGLSTHADDPLAEI